MTDKKVERWEFLSGLLGVEKRQYWDNKKRKFRDYDFNYFTDRRINAKFNEMVERYKNVIDRDMLFDYSKEIIEKIVLVKDYVYISIDEKKDDISFIITTLGQRINNKIDKYTGTYRDRRNREDKKVNIKLYSLDYEYEDYEGNTYTLGDTITNENNIFYSEAVEETDEEVERSLQKIYKLAKLTDREIEVLQALEKTRDNIIQNTYYNKAEASRILGCSRENVSKIFTNIKRKIAKVYKIEYTRQDRINELYDLLDSLESEIEIINYINDNLETNIDTETILYRVDPILIQYFLKNRLTPDTYRSDMMRKFVTYYIKEIYDYIELLKLNDEINKDSKRDLHIA